MKTTTILGIKLAGLRVKFLEARVGIGLYEFVDSTDVVDFIGSERIARLAKYARNAAFGDVQVTRDFEAKDLSKGGSM